MTKSFLCALMLLITFSAAAASLRGREDPGTTLTGGGERVWVAGDFSSYSAGGSDGYCKGRDTLIFNSGQTLTRRMCRDKKLVVESDVKWWLYTDGGRLMIMIGKTACALHLDPQGTKGWKMTLTYDNGPNKSDGLTDSPYYYKAPQP